GFDGNYVRSLDNFPGFTPARLLIPTAGAASLDCMATFANFYNTALAASFPDVTAAAGGCGLPPALNGVVVVYAGVPLPKDPNVCSTACAPLVTSTNNPLDTTTWANAYQPSLFSNYSHEIDHGYWAGFVQDQWKITHKLTLNYGVRYEYESGLSSYVKPDYNGVQPRVGLAYSPDSKTVIRAGFGIFDDRYNLTFFFVPNTQKVVAGYLCGNHAPSAVAADCAAAGVLPQELPMLAFNLTQATQGYQLFATPNNAAAIAKSIIATGGYDAFTNTGGPTGTVTLAGTCLLPHSTPGPPYLACGVGSGGMDHNARTPYAEQGSLEIDRQFSHGFALSLSYLFVGAHKLVRGNNLNIPCPVGTTKSAAPTDPVSIFPTGPGEWVPGLLNPNGNSSPCAGTPTLGTGALAGLGPWFGGALNSGLQTISAGLIDYNNDVANATYHGLNVSGAERIGRFFTLNANYTYSHTQDNGNFTTFVNLPVNQFDFRAERSNSNQDLRHRFVANFTANTPVTGWYRNFQFSSIITLQTGRPFTIFSGINTLNDLASSNTDRVGGAPFGSSCPSVDHCQTMIPRNTYFGDVLRTWDLRVGRSFHLTEHKKLDLAVDAFNLFNRPNVDEVTPVYGSPVFCGGGIPKNYKDATSLAIAQAAASTACPAGPIPVIPGVPQAGSLAPTPITGALPTCNFAPACPAHLLFIPFTPNANFGQPRTM
ncbi:MAG TPA: TonB-dependent receptor, partial [Blastocatellia bacterium]